MMAATDNMCSICREPIVPGALGDDAQHRLPCLHAYHSYCITQLLQVSGADASDLPCPDCRSTPAVMQEAERQLLDLPAGAEALGVGVEGAADADGPPPVVEVASDDDNDALGAEVALDDQNAAEADNAAAVPLVV